MEWYNQNGIEIAPKDENPPNSPEQRINESYCNTVVNRLLLKSNKSAEDEEFKQKWIAALKEVTESKIQLTMAPTTTKKFDYLLSVI